MFSAKKRQRIDSIGKESIYLQSSYFLESFNLNNENNFHISDQHVINVVNTNNTISCSTWIVPVSSVTTRSIFPIHAVTTTFNDNSESVTEISVLCFFQSDMGTSNYVFRLNNQILSFLTIRFDGTILNIQNFRPELKIDEKIIQLIHFGKFK
jgi:hypothetical protein